MQVTRVGIVDANGDTVEYPASLVGSDAQHDIAVLLVDAPDQSFAPVQVGTSADLRTGQSVYAIGNPLGFSKTLTAGVVSGVNRAIPSPVGTKTYGAIQVAVLASAWLPKKNVEGYVYKVSTQATICYANCRHLCACKAVRLSQNTRYSVVSYCF